MFRILLFDDYPYVSENMLFRDQLDLECPEQCIVIEEKSVAGFENTIRNSSYNLVILDIMAEVKGALASVGDGSPVPSTRTGIELLRRIRRGHYGEAVSKLPVFIRTARGEHFVRDECMKVGATAYCRVGADDHRILDAVKKMIEA